MCPGMEEQEQKRQVGNLGLTASPSGVRRAGSNQEVSVSV